MCWWSSRYIPWPRTYCCLDFRPWPVPHPGSNRPPSRSHRRKQVKRKRPQAWSQTNSIERFLRSGPRPPPPPAGKSIQRWSLCSWQSLPVLSSHLAIYCFPTEQESRIVENTRGPYKLMKSGRTRTACLAGGFIWRPPDLEEAPADSCREKFDSGGTGRVACAIFSGKPMAPRIRSIRPRPGGQTPRMTFHAPPLPRRVSAKWLPIQSRNPVGVPFPAK